MWKPPTKYDEMILLSLLKYGPLKSWNLAKKVYEEMRNRKSLYKEWEGIVDNRALRSVYNSIYSQLIRKENGRLAILEGDRLIKFSEKRKTWELTPPGIVLALHLDPEAEVNKYYIDSMILLRDFEETMRDVGYVLPRILHMITAVEEPKVSRVPTEDLSEEERRRATSYLIEYVRLYGEMANSEYEIMHSLNEFQETPIEMYSEFLIDFLQHFLSGNPDQTSELDGLIDKIYHDDRRIYFTFLLCAIQDASKAGHFYLKAGRESINAISKILDKLPEEYRRRI